jgi:septum formation protein
MNISLQYPLILASKSPRRQQLLKQAGFQFEIQDQPVEEIYPPELEPKDVPLYLAELKAQPFVAQSHKSIIITADTVVLLDDNIIGKPANETEATRMLQKLSGRQHTVITGICILHQGEALTFKEITNVYFRSLSSNEIAQYVSHFQPLDKAGAYGIQDWIGLVGVNRIEGDFYNVMGLPVLRLYLELMKWATS